MLSFHFVLTNKAHFLRDDRTSQKPIFLFSEHWYFVDFCARIRMGPEKVENFDSLTFRKAKNHKFASRKLISQYGFVQKMG